MGNYVVRVVCDRAKADRWGDLLEQFRYLGMVLVHRDDKDGMCFDIFSHSRSKNPERIRNWCLRIAERMQSFGINAVAAPAWPVKLTDVLKKG